MVDDVVVVAVTAVVAFCAPSFGFFAKDHRHETRVEFRDLENPQPSRTTVRCRAFDNEKKDFLGRDEPTTTQQRRVILETGSMVVAHSTH